MTDDIDTLTKWLDAESDYVDDLTNANVLHENLHNGVFIVGGKPLVVVEQYSEMIGLDDIEDNVVLDWGGEKFIFTMRHDSWEYSDRIGGVHRVKKKPVIKEEWVIV